MGGRRECFVSFEMRLVALIRGSSDVFYLFGFREQLIQLGDNLERIGHIQHVGFPACPSTVGIQIDGSAFVDETPADHMWLFTMAAGRKTFGMAWGCAGLAHLIQVGHKSKHCLILTALVHQRFAAAQRSAGIAKELEDQLFRFRSVRFSIGVLPRPTSASGKQIPHSAMISPGVQPAPQ